MLAPITRIRLVFLIGAPALVGLSLWLVGHERGMAQGAAGAISFSQQSYSINEGGNATITLTRTGGTSNQVVAKVGITDVTTSPSDYMPLFPGKIDTTFTPTTKPGNAVNDLAIQPDGKVLVTGFQTPDGSNSGDGLVRLNPNGTQDTSFNPAVIVAEGTALGLQPDGKILVVGFVRLTAGGLNVGIARLNSDGSLDSTFNVGTGFNEYSVNALAIQPDGKIIVGGNFPKYNGVSRPYLVRLNPDGTLDQGFAAGTGPDAQVLAVALQPDGKVLIGGRFNTYDGITRKNLARLNPNGSLDSTFVIPSVIDDLNVWDIAVQPDGKVLVGGIFYVSSPTDGTTLTPLFRLNSDGTQDQSFTSTLGHKNMTRAIVIQPDGKIFVGGLIVRTPQDPLYFLNRLNTDGTRDTTFSSGIVAFSNSSAHTLAMQGDGKLVVGGQFTGATSFISWKFLHRLEGDMFVTWPAGDATDKTISLPAVDDSIVEPSESMTLSLSLIQGGATIGTNSTASLTITDNDTQITTVSGSGVFAGTASMTATLSTFSAPLSGKTITFTLNSTNVGSAITDANGVATLTNVSLAGINAGIYQGAIVPRFAGDSSFGSSTSAGTLTVSKAAATLTLSPGSVNPSDVGQSVNFTVTATSPAGTPSGTVVIKSDGATVSTNISLNSSGIAILIATGLTTGTHNITTELNSTNFTASPSAPVSHTVKVAPTLSINDVVSIEGNVNQRIAIFTVTLTPTSAANVTVNYSTQNGTAASGSDYQSTSNSLTFSPGTSTRTIFVNINGDNTVEPDETFLVNLSVPQNATIARSPGTGFIVGDDNSPGNPLDLPGFFVRQNYVDFLSRDPDASGFQFWRNQITSCGTDAQCTEVRRIDVSASFFLSIEFQQTGYLVERFYKVAYGDASGTSNFPANHQLAVPIVRRSEFQTDTQRIGQGVVVLAPGWEQLLESNKQAYALEFVQTARFGSAFPTTMTPEQFVDKLNQNAGDVLSASEKATAINLFGGAADSSNTTARAQAVRQVAEDLDLYNAEFNRAFVLAEYFGYLRRNPNDAPDSDYTGYDFWLTKLNQFNGNYINAEMVKAFLSSIEYRQRFGP